MSRLGFVALLVLALALPSAGYSPSIEFALNCQGCHRADGAGTPGTIPALVGSVARFLSVPGGREYLIQVPGVAQAPLDDATLAGVVNWMLTHYDAAHVPAGFAPYDAAEVGRLRATPLIDVDRVRDRLLEAMAR